MWQSQQISAINQLLYAMSAPPNYTLGQRPQHLASHAYEDNPADATDDEDDEQIRTLYIGNLDDRVTEDLLYEVFLQAGPIETIRIPKDNNGRKRSYGFVTYSHRCTPSYAIQLFAGLQLYRKVLIIKLQAEPNAPNKRRSLPNDCERFMSRPTDNTMLRSTSYPSFYDPNMNDSSISTAFNPFRTNSPVFGGSNRNRDGDVRKAERERGNTRAHPYQRDNERRGRDEGQRYRR